MSDIDTNPTAFSNPVKRKDCTVGNDDIWEIEFLEQHLDQKLSCCVRENGRVDEKNWSVSAHNWEGAQLL